MCSAKCPSKADKSNTFFDLRSSKQLRWTSRRSVRRSKGFLTGAQPNSAKTLRHLPVSLPMMRFPARNGRPPRPGITEVGCSGSAHGMRFIGRTTISTNAIGAWSPIRGYVFSTRVYPPARSL